MKAIQQIPLFLVLLLLFVNVGQSLEAGAPSLPVERSLSGCDVAQGFAAGAMLGAAIAALTPGGQTAAAILGLTAVSLRVGMSVIC